MTNGYKFTCVAARYSIRGGLNVMKGWSIRLHMSDPRMALFFQNPAFQAEPVHVPEPNGLKLKPAKTAKSAGDPNKVWGDVGLDKVDDLAPDIVAKLQAGGLATVKSVLDAGKEGLLKVKGIGDATADKILVMVEPYTKQADDED